MPLPAGTACHDWPALTEPLNKAQVERVSEGREDESRPQRPRPEQRNLLQAEIKVWRPGSIRTHPAESLGGLECEFKQRLAGAMREYIILSDPL